MGEIGYAPTLLQPKAVVRTDGDGLLYSIQRDELQMLWVDVCKVENYIDYNHINRYYIRLATIVEAACRREIPVIMAGHDRKAWKTTEMHHLINRTGLTKSEHA